MLLIPYQLERMASENKMLFEVLEAAELLCGDLAARPVLASVEVPTALSVQHLASPHSPPSAETWPSRAESVARADC